MVDPYDLKNVRTVLKEELAKDGPSVVISRRACVLFKREKSAVSKPFRIDADKCIGCRLCLGLGCPPIAWKSINQTPVADGVSEKKNDGIAVIDRNLCTGCGLCRQLCKSGAILEET